MSKGRRLTEQWLQRGLWLVAVVFALFLNNLGSSLIGHLRLAERPLQLEQFMDPRADADTRAALQRLQVRERQLTEREQDAQRALEVARSNTRQAQEVFDNWIATRSATARPDQDPALIERTRQLEAVRSAERKAEAGQQAAAEALALHEREQQRAREARDALERQAGLALEKETRNVELRVFLYRLVLTLPLLLAAGWLYRRKRDSQYWPFVWGFIFFALSAFFVELVPYLPSYGGYVRNVVGVALTVLIGRQAILALQRYLARQRAAEAMPDAQRRSAMRYDVALGRLAKSVCPGCERQVDLKDGKTDFCPHCGIRLFDHCRVCNTRKGSFTRYCFACGTAGSAELTDGGAGAGGNAPHGQTMGAAGSAPQGPVPGA